MRWQDLSRFLHGLADLAFPNSCLLCGVQEAIEVPLAHGFCPVCRQSVADDPHECCPDCATTIGPFTDLTSGCPVCRSHAFAFEGAVRLGPYEGSLRTAILRLKSQSGETLAERLGMLFAEVRRDELTRHAPDLVIPVPLHWRRRISRGYNQAEAVAVEVARSLGLPCRAGWLRRIRPTPQQLQPSASAREANVRGAFRPAWRARFEGRTVLIIDDVMTTGSTMSEAARVVRRAGAKKVVAGVLGRTVLG